MPPRNLSCSSSAYVDQVEKFTWSRPWWTWFAIIQFIGVMFVYHGQRVSVVWQSRQDRSMIAATCGVALLIREPAAGDEGLVRSGRTNCAPMNATRKTIRTVRVQRRINAIAVSRYA